LLGIIIASVVLYFVLYRLVEDKRTVNVKSVLMLVAIPAVAIMLFRFLLNTFDTDPTINLVISLLALVISIIYVFFTSKAKFNLSNLPASGIAVTYFLSIWASEFLHSVIVALLFT